MNTLTLFATIGLAALIHASFQLSVSMLTILSGHALGSKTSHNRTISLASSFTLGAMTMTMLLLSFCAYLAANLFGTSIRPIVWAVVCGLMLGIGLAVCVFYYRPTRGTSLWIPRSMARFLMDRSKATKLSAEAYSLGLTGVVGEIIFILAPLAASALCLVQLPAAYQIAGVLIYTVIASLPLFIVVLLVGGGHSLSRIQHWREDNRRFLQFIAGGALFVLGFFLYVNAVITPTAIARGGLF
jgi:hypothetical protein